MPFISTRARIIEQNSYITRRKNASQDKRDLRIAIAFLFTLLSGAPLIALAALAIFAYAQA